jgi:hypothetical protein
LGIGDWGLGIGDWGLGPIPNPHIIYFNFNFYVLIIKILNYSFPRRILIKTIIKYILIISSKVLLI